MDKKEMAKFGSQLFDIFTAQLFADGILNEKDLEDIEVVYKK